MSNTEGKSLERSDEKPGIEGRWDGAVCVLKESEFGKEGGRCSDEVSSENVRVTTNVLGRRSYDDCGTEEKGLGEIGRRESVVDHEGDVATLSDGSE